MSFIGDIVGDALGNLLPTGGSRGRKLAKLVREGERLDGVIDGFRIREESDSGEKHWVSVEVRGPSGPFRATVRQRLIPNAELATLGTPVTVLHLDGRVAVDWPGTLRARGIDPVGDPPVIADKTLKEPLPPGIDDGRSDRKKLERGTPAEATVIGVEEVVVMGMPTQNVHLDLDIEGRRVHVKRALVPRYAVHLVVPGAVLPVAVDPKKPDKVTIDWPTAAERAAAAR